MRNSVESPASLGEIKHRLIELGDKEQAKNLQRFFKTGPGEYGEGDVFLGIRVPDVRALVRETAALPIEDIVELLRSEIHESRYLATATLVRRFQRGNTVEKERVFRLYLENRAFVNNWDLVDTSTPHIVGTYLFDKDRSILFEFAKSDDLWERRISIMATQEFIRRRDFADTLRIADILLNDKHDLIHKAVGWMLREIGNRDLETEEAFLRTRYKTMPRTMLRYAIEKFPETRRIQYLKGEV